MNLITLFANRNSVDALFSQLNNLKNGPFVACHHNGTLFCKTGRRLLPLIQGEPLVWFWVPTPKVCRWVPPPQLLPPAIVDNEEEMDGRGWQMVINSDLEIF